MKLLMLPSVIAWRPINLKINKSQYKKTSDDCLVVDKLVHVTDTY